MKKIAIYGAGGLGRETALLIQQINMQSRKWSMLGFYDDGLKKDIRVDDWPVLGGIQELEQLKESINLVVSIADPMQRKSLVDRIVNKQVTFPTIIHPTCQTGDANNKFGQGCILTAGVILTTGLKLGDFVIVNLASTMGHDVVIGNYSTIMPGCSISGNVKVGQCSLVGTGVRILQNLTIGAHCKIGAGAVVIQSFSDDKTIVGVPAHEK